MRHCCTFLLLAGFLASADDLTPRVGSVEVYGARKTPVQKIRKALNVNPGDFLPSREQSEDRINSVAGILAARVEAACCTEGKMILYVGVEERDEPHLEFHPAPTGTDELPQTIIGNYRRLLDEVEDSLRGKNADEDLTNGYSLMADPDCRSIQKGFVQSVPLNLPILAKVLRESSDPEQRAAAAYLLQYTPRGPRTTSIMMDGLQWALRDEEDIVRDRAMNSMRAVIVGAKLHPDQAVKIEPTWLIELMNSVVWSDRFHASQALAEITETRDPETLALLKSRALPSVIEMARWHDLKHALPSFILAGRLAGLDDKQIKQAWLSENRETVIKAAIGTDKKKAKS